MRGESLGFRGEGVGFKGGIAMRSLLRFEKHPYAELSELVPFGWVP